MDAPTNPTKPVGNPGIRLEDLTEDFVDTDEWEGPSLEWHVRWHG